MDDNCLLRLCSIYLPVYVFSYISWTLVSHSNTHEKASLSVPASQEPQIPKPVLWQKIVGKTLVHLIQVIIWPSIW